MDDAILRVSAYPRVDFYPTVKAIPDNYHARVRSSISSDFRSTASFLGDIDVFPVGITSAICQELDTASLFAFRQVNLRARQIVDSLYAYQIAATQTLDCLCALLRTGSASWVTLTDYYRVLCTPFCSNCTDRFGDKVNLLSWTRCCSDCLHDFNPNIQAITLATAKEVLQLPPSINIRVLRSLRGTYSLWEEESKSRQLVLARDAISSSCEFLGIQGFPEMLETQGIDDINNTGYAQIVKQLKMYEGFSEKACFTLPFYGSQTRIMQHAICCAGCRLALERGNAAFDNIEVLRTLEARKYYQKSFLEHFQSCESAQLLWHSSDNGNIESEGLPEICRKSRYAIQRLRSHDCDKNHSSG